MVLTPAGASGFPFPGRVSKGDLLRWAVLGCRGYILVEHGLRDGIEAIVHSEDIIETDGECAGGLSESNELLSACFVRSIDAWLCCATDRAQEIGARTIEGAPWASTRGQARRLTSVRFDIRNPSASRRLVSWRAFL